MQKITPFLWFDGKAEEAMNFYVSIFKNSRVLGVTRYGEAGPGPKGSVMTASFELDGQRFVALNGGPKFTFSPAISFVIDCQTQQQVDELWEKLSAGGRKDRCGWLIDTCIRCVGPCHTFANAAWYLIVPDRPRNAPGSSSSAIKTSSGTSYSQPMPKRDAGTKPKRG